MRLAPELDWEIWRIAMSDKFTDSLKTIQNDWTIVEVELANEILDQLG